MNITGQFERIDFTPIVARARLGTRAMACRGRVIGDEGTGGRLETWTAFATGNFSFFAPDRLPVTGRDDCGFSNEAALLSQRTTGGGLDH